MANFESLSRYIPNLATFVVAGLVLALAKCGADFAYENLSGLRPSDLVLQNRYRSILQHMLKKEIITDKTSMRDLIYSRRLQCGGVYYYRSNPRKMPIFRNELTVLKFADSYIVTIAVKPLISGKNKQMNITVMLSLLSTMSSDVGTADNLIVSVLGDFILNYTHEPNCNKHFRNDLPRKNPAPPSHPYPHNGPRQIIIPKSYKDIPI